MAIEFAGKTYDVEQSMFDSLKTGVETKYAALESTDREKILAKMLAAFLSPDKTYAKVQRAAAIKAEQDTLNGDKRIKAVLAKLSKGYKTYTETVKGIESTFGGKVQVDALTGAFSVHMPVDAECPVTLGSVLKTFGEADVRFYPETTEDNARTMVAIKGDIAGAKEKRDAYLAMLKTLTETVPQVVDMTNKGAKWNPDTNTVELSDKLQRQAGAPRTSGGSNGDKAWGGRVRWDGKEFEGTNKELFEKLTAAGFEFSESMVKWKTYSYITATDAHHCSKDIEVIEKFTGEKKTA